MDGFRFDLSAPHIVVPVRITGAQRVRWLNLILDTGSTSTVIDELVPFGSDTIWNQHRRFL